MHLPTEVAAPTTPIPFHFLSSGTMFPGSMFPIYPGPTQDTTTSACTEATSGVSTPTRHYPIPEFDSFTMGSDQAWEEGLIGLSLISGP